MRVLQSMLECTNTNKKNEVFKKRMLRELIQKNKKFGKNPYIHFYLFWMSSLSILHIKEFDSLKSHIDIVTVCNI